MSPVQLMLWTLIVGGWFLAVYFWVRRDSLGARADRMVRASDHMWLTGECVVCGGVAFDHADGCELHVYLGGDMYDVLDDERDHGS